MVKKIFDKIADALVPKEIAPFLGPAAMAFAGPLSMPLALGIGQLGAAKMMSGKLDPYTALGTVLSAQGYKARNPQGYGRIGSGLKQGILSIGDGPGGKTFFDAFQSGYNNPGYIQGLQTGLETTSQIFPGDLTGEELDKYKSFTTDAERSEYMKSLQPGSGTLPTQKPVQITETDELISPKKGFFESQGFLDEATQSIGESIFPGFTSVDPDTGNNVFNFGKALRTIGAVTTISALAPMAEELKKQKLKDKEEEGKLFKEWFNSYKRVSGRDYAQSPFPDPTLMEKYKEFMMAEGGRVGYNMGGGIMDAAPGVPPGMELDYRDSGGFIPMGSQEKKDDVPAVLAKNEFVLTSDAMSGLDKMMGGSGDPRAAAKYMYQMMDQLEAMA